MKVPALVIPLDKAKRFGVRAGCGAHQERQGGGQETRSKRLCDEGSAHCHEASVIG